MDFDVSDRWINTLSANGWKSASVNKYWQEVFGLKTGECLFVNDKWNESLFTQHAIDKNDLKKSLMYLTNRVCSNNPHPGFWALRQMKTTFFEQFSTEFSICFNEVLAHHQDLLPEFFLIGGQDCEFSEVIDVLIKNKKINYIPDVLQYFTIAKNGNRRYQKLNEVREVVYKSIGLTSSGELGGSSLKMEWFNTAHIQNAIENVSIFQEILQDITNLYPSRYAIECLTSYISSPHQSKTSNTIIAQKILNTPLENQSLEILEQMVTNEMFFIQTLTACIDQNWLFSNHETMQKFLSLAPAQTVENVFAEICERSEHSLLNKANALCEWTNSDFHARITQMAVLSACKNHRHLYNNMQKMTLVSEVHSEQKTPGRKM